MLARWAAGGGVLAWRDGIGSHSQARASNKWEGGMLVPASRSRNATESRQPCGAETTASLIGEWAAPPATRAFGWEVCELHVHEEASLAPLTRPQRGDSTCAALNVCALPTTARARARCTAPASEIADAPRCAPWHRPRAIRLLRHRQPDVGCVLQPAGAAVVPTIALRSVRHDVWHWHGTQAHHATRTM